MNLSAIKEAGCLVQALVGLVVAVGASLAILLLAGLLGFDLLSAIFRQLPQPTATPTSTPVVTVAPTTAATSAPTSAPTTAPTTAPTSTPLGEMPVPVNLRSEPVEGEPGSFIVFWEYPTEGDVAPESFNIEINGQLYEETSYEGTGFEYSWYVGEQPCGSTLDVQVVAVAGSLRGPSEILPVDTGAC
jgi:hypothetical protein